MSSTTITGTTPYRPQEATDYPAGSLRFDWAIILASLLFLAGQFLDGWAHNNLASSLESFFTPWHAVLYAGFFAVTGVLVFTQVRNMQRGYPWTHALPNGYWLSLLGVMVFSVGGVGDMIWHTVFGIEANMEALLSPTHLILATGAMLIYTGPLRAAWGRSTAEIKPGWGDLLPALISLLMTHSLLTFFTQYAHIMNYPALLVQHPTDATYLATYFPSLYGVTSAIIPAALVMGAILLALHRWDLPRGSLTLLFTANTALMWLMKYNRASGYWVLLIAAFAAGLLGDLLLVQLKPSMERTWALRLFAFSVPFTLVLFNHLALIATAGMWWTIHMWLGVPFVAGVVGLLLSYLAQPPIVPQTEERIR